MIEEKEKSLYSIGRKESQPKSMMLPVVMAMGSLSSIQYPASSIQYPVSSIEYPVASSQDHAVSSSADSFYPLIGRG
jgi:hypothetical protein